MRRSEFKFVDVWNELRNDFRMGSDSRFHSRLTGVQPQGSGADYHIRNERQWLHMIERARFYRREDPVVSQGVRRLISNIIQDGFNLDVDTGDDALNRDLKQRWWDWSEDPAQCHSEKEFTFQQMERMTLDQQITDGDLFFLPLRSGALQAIEAHRVRTPQRTVKNVVHGILLDDNAVREEYWVTREDLGLSHTPIKVSDVAKYKARDEEGNRQVLHIYDPYRFSQRRGITAFAPVSFTIGSHDDIQFATLVKQQIGALIAILRERGADWQPPRRPSQLGQEALEESYAHNRPIEGLAAGMDVAGEPGEKLSMFSSNVPGPQFREHAMMILTFIAINLDLPVCVLLLDPSETNFSGWRGAMDQARQRWRQMQQQLVQSFHTPVYLWKVRQWITQDAALAKAARRSDIQIFNHTWNPPSWPYLEPLKDAAADELQDTKLLNSKRRIQAARGRDWETISSEIIADNATIVKKALEMAKEINAIWPDAKLDWRELLRLPTATSVTGSLQYGDPQARMS